ncbi:MAG: ceramidase domain-containing protein [Rhizobiaceae bacterium]|nr:ceramidase domain-containing protein [Rhizobiaceae bacterium]
MNSALFAPIDLYCERHGPEFWAEPVNALTNLAFVAAGIWGLYQVRRNRTGTAAIAMCWWVIAIGIGSWLFHTFANYLTIWADIVPIATFTLAASMFALRRFARLSWPRATVCFVGFYLVAGAITLTLPSSVHVATNGTSGYLPAFLAINAIGALCLVRGSPAGRYLIAASLIFALAATGRMLDLWACQYVPIGTHFLWHSLNGLMLAVVLTAIARYGRPAA